MLVGHTSTGPGTAQRRNLVTQLWAYLDDILSRREGLKALLCDDTTRTILTLGYTQQQLLRHGVVLVDSLSNSQRFCMKHFSCVVLCRPSATSLASLFQELAEGNFSSYHLFLTSVVSAQLLQSLAEADVLNLVASVEEVFMDSAPITEWVGTTFLKPPALGASPILMNPIGAAHWDSSYIARMADSVVSMALSMNRRPVIRYRGGSTTAKLLAEQVATRMTTVHAAFPDLKASDAVLLILDRMDDPVTPLLMPWTYEAMIHELIGFQNGNEVMLDSEKNEDKPEDRVHVLTSYSDSFYEQHRYDDWGQVCIAVSEMVKTYKEMNNFDRQAVSLDEIRNFMSRFPEARKQSVQVTRHCGIASQMVAEINSRSLTKLSILEQDMIAHHNLSEHSRLVLEAVQDPTTDVDDALRIAMLYSLHYEGTSGHIIPQLKQELQRRQCSPDQVALIDRLLKYGGQQQRAHELFRSSTASSVFKSMAKAVGQFGKEVQNVLTQHTPLLQKLVNRTYNGSLDEERYPPQDVPGSPISTDTVPNLRPKDIFVVCLGGVTFSEARCIANVNAGLVDNDCERLMRLGKTVSRKLGGGSTTEAEPQTAKIEARVTLLSTAMISSKEFLRSLPPF